MENWTEQPVQVTGKSELKRSLGLGMGGRVESPRGGTRGKPKEINQLIFLFYMIFKMRDRLSEERERDRSVSGELNMGKSSKVIV